MTDQWTTPWYPPRIRPVRLGVYERNHGVGDNSYSFWNGKYWCPIGDTPQYAAWARGESCFQDLPWRGLTKEAK